MRDVRVRVPNKSVRGGPGSEVGIELSKGLDGVDERGRVNASELWNVVSGRREKLIVEMNVAAEVAEV